MLGVSKLPLRASAPHSRARQGAVTHTFCPSLKTLEKNPSSEKDLQVVGVDVS